MPSWSGAPSSIASPLPRLATLRSPLPQRSSGHLPDSIGDRSNSRCLEGGSVSPVSGDVQAFSAGAPVAQGAEAAGLLGSAGAAAGCVEGVGQDLVAIA